MEAIGKQALRPKQEAPEDKQRFPCNVRIRDVNGNEIGVLNPGKKDVAINSQAFHPLRNRNDLSIYLQEKYPATSVSRAYMRMLLQNRCITMLITIFLIGRHYLRSKKPGCPR
jgi:hypothetical protein